MRKFAVFSGFLGSGKTTTMMALTRCYGNAAMISNDLGGSGLADNRLAQLAGCNASELTGACICYQTENLVARLDELFDDGFELVISDIPGFGVGALEHVYHILNERYEGRYELAPFTVLVEPRTVELLRSGSGGDLTYILETQLVEADLIVLNKCNLLDEAQRADAISYLSGRYGRAQVMAVSALTGEGIERLYSALTQEKGSMHRPDIGYGGPAFSAAMGRISEYNIQYYATVCCHNFDGNAYLTTLAEAIRSNIQKLDAEIPHLKLLAWEPEGDYGKADLLGTVRPIEVSRHFTHPCTEMAVVLNASALCPSDKLDAVITGAVEHVSKEFQLELIVYKKECFGMGG